MAILLHDQALIGISVNIAGESNVYFPHQSCHAVCNAACNHDGRHFRTVLMSELASCKCEQAGGGVFYNGSNDGSSMEMNEGLLNNNAVRFDESKSSFSGLGGMCLYPAAGTAGSQIVFDECYCCMALVGLKAHQQLQLKGPRHLLIMWIR